MKHQILSLGWRIVINTCIVLAVATGVGLVYELSAHGPWELGVVVGGFGMTAFFALRALVRLRHH